MKKSFICIPVLLLAVSLYAQPMVSSGASIRSGITIRETGLAENSYGILFNSTLAGDLGFSYAIKNGLTIVNMGLNIN